MSPLQYLTTMLPAVPYVLAILAGVAVAGFTWHRHPNLSGLVILASLVEILNVVGGGLLTEWLASSAVHSAHPSRVGMIIGVMGLVRSILSAGVWTLVLVAIFRKRGALDPAAAQASAVTSGRSSWG